MSECVSTVEPRWSLRRAGEEAWPFVLATWLRSYRNSTFARPISAGVYHAMHHQIAERILRRGALVIVATPNDDQDLYFGWAVFEPQVLHYVFVKPSFRGIGIAQGLARASSARSYTHLLPTDEPIDLGGMRYNPYLV